LALFHYRKRKQAVQDLQRDKYYMVLAFQLHLFQWDKSHHREQMMLLFLEVSLYTRKAGHYHRLEKLVQQTHTDDHKV